MFNSRQREQLAGARAQVECLQARLSSNISTLDPGDDLLCRHALADASERNSAAGGLLASATTLSELQLAQRIVVEGLTATRIVREHQGLPLGPELPAPPTTTVSVPAAVTVGDERHIPHPDYHPEQPHFFGGGTISGSTAPAGYYRTPFWKKALAIGGAVVGAQILGDVVGDMFDGDRGYGGGSWGGGDADGGEDIF